MRLIFKRHARRTKISILSVGVIGLLLSLLPLGNARALTPTFVQTNYKETGSGTTDSVAFTKANSSSDLIVAYVIWSNTSSVSLSDTRGNTYTSTSAPVKFESSGWSSQIFYAKNVAAGTNTVTANFASSINSFGILYIHEYSGIDTVNPLDVTAGASGTAKAMSSGSATTTNPNDLIFGGGASSNTVTAKGTGFTTRSNGSGNMTEDEIVSTTGSYSATATQNGNGWAMQMAAFRAAGSTPDTTPPSVPTGLTATTQSSSQISLNWTASTDNVGVTGYNVYRNGVKVGTSTTTTYQDTGLMAGTTYTYTVAAYDAAGNVSAQSAGVNATTQPPDTTPPTVPTGLTATPVSSSEIDLSWSSSTDNVGVAGYNIYRNGVQVGTTTTALTYKDQNLTANTTYAYTVSAYDAAGNVSSQSSPVNATTQAPDTTPPSAPTGLTATTQSSSQVNLNWTASTDNVGVTGYNVYRNGTQIATATTTSYQDSGLTANTTYNYTVAAYDAAGNVSAQSTVATATTTNSPTVSVVQEDDTGTFTGNDTGLGSGVSYQVLPHPTQIGDTVVLITQSLTDPNRTTDTITSISSNIGTFHFVNSYNDDADNEIWVCTNTTGAADTVAVNTPTNAWQAFAIEFSAPATSVTDGGGRVDENLGYLSNQNLTVSPGAAGNAVVVQGDTLDAYTKGPAAPWSFYNHGYWGFDNGTSAAWQIVSSAAPVTATWQTDGGLSSIQAVVLGF